MFYEHYKRALDVILKKPVMLWGLSLLMGVLIGIAGAVTFSIPFLCLAVMYLFSCGAAKLYMDGLKGKQVNSKQLFAAFNKNAVKTAGALAWRDLWLVIWSAVPVVNIVKFYSYSFVPYIVMTRPEISAFDALKISMKMANGKKMQMFLADLVFAIAPGISLGILGALAAIPVIGIVFGLAVAVLILALALFGGIFAGLYKASFFNEEEIDQFIEVPEAAESVAV